MKVLHLGKYYPPFSGGVETVTFNLVEGINQHGIICDVLCANDRAHTIVEKSNGYTIYRAGILGHWFSTPFSYKLIKVLFKIKDQYDIIHVHLPNPMAVFAVFLLRPKSKLILHWHSDIIKQKYLLKLYLPLQKWILRRAYLIVGTTAKYVECSYQLKDVLDKTIIVPLGVDYNMLSINKTLSEEIKHKYSGKNIVFTLGRHVYYKGFEYLIHAAKYLTDDYVILIGGKGKDTDKFRLMIKALNLNNRVVLLGHLSDEEVGAYFNACDVSCLPSIAKSEAFGVVLIEAMALGKPIVATDLDGSGVSWVNQNGVTGWNVPIMDSVALSDALKNLFSDKDQYQKMSENCKSRYNQVFTVKCMVDAFLKIYGAKL